MKTKVYESPLIEDVDLFVEGVLCFSQLEKPSEEFGDWGDSDWEETLKDA